MEYKNKHPSRPFVATKAEHRLSRSLAGINKRPLASILCWYSPLTRSRLLGGRCGTLHHFPPLYSFIIPSSPLNCNSLSVIIFCDKTPFLRKNRLFFAQQTNVLLTFPFFDCPTNACFISCFCSFRLFVPFSLANCFRQRPIRPVRQLFKSAFCSAFAYLGAKKGRLRRPAFCVFYLSALAA